MPRRHKLVAGNWKMNAAPMAEFDAIIAGRGAGAGAETLICPPATMIAALASRPRGAVEIGAQDCHPATAGAHTGDISAEMLRDAGARFVIVGHSERRADHGESDAQVRAKAEAVWRAGMIAIVCLGETEAERDAGGALAVIGRQLAQSLPDDAVVPRLVVAYEPVWAIGSGRIPSLEQIEQAHRAIRAGLEARYGAAGAATRVLYGGSVKPGNAAEIFSVGDVDGALVGGASLRAADFLPIVAAASAAA